MAQSLRQEKSPKKLLKDLFDLKKISRPLFIPLIYRYASRVSKMPPEAMVKDPVALSRSLIMAQELFEYDAIVSNYDPYLELCNPGRSLGWAQKDVLNGFLARKRKSCVTGRTLESFDEIGHLPAIYEAITHVCEIVGREVPVIGVMNSPVTLVRMVTEEKYDSWGGHREELREALNDAQAFVLDYIKTCCNHRVDAIWLIEEDWTFITPEDLEWLKPIYNTFWNVTRYYDVKSVMGFHDYEPGMVDHYFDLGADAVFLGGYRAGEIPLPRVAEWVEKYGKPVGLGCPYPETLEDNDRLSDLVDFTKDLGYGVFLSTCHEVPLNTSIDLINAIMERVKG
ncbi:MAG: methylcobalamin:coenzyme M methyltransferase [Syntrophorhabdus sp. PtaU1.Bin058]|nr:MAG: methylcobalamin:coenzyme M methyltransferase [Syntrophorhabdus sp. PtaU1.Bin058]